MTSPKRVRLVPWHTLTRESQMYRLHWLKYRMYRGSEREQLAARKLSQLCENLYYYGVTNPMKGKNPPRQTAHASQAYDP